MVAAHSLIFAFGVLGNIISFLVYLAPLPTFWRIYKTKTTEGFKSLPYICAIFSSMVWIYYAMVKTNSFLLITINGFGCLIETVYILLFLFYASKQAKMKTLKRVVFLNIFGFASIILVCKYVAKEEIRVQFLGVLCVVFSIIVFASPLSIIRRVIQTKSVEYMPFPLSLTLTISAVLWFMYGLLQKDLYIVLPNVIGFAFGVTQMIIYVIYRIKSKQVGPIKISLIKLPEKITCTENVGHESPQATSNAVAEEVTVVVAEVKENGNEESDVEEDIEAQVPRELHMNVPSSSPSCGFNEIKNADPMPVGALPLAISVV